MKSNKFLTILFFTLLFFFQQGVVYSLEERVLTEQYFQVEYEIGRQSVWNNSIPLNIYITPHSDFNRVEITFGYGGMTEVRYRGPQFFPVKAGETYNVQARVYPKERGPHHVTINAIAWEYDTNYTSSASANIPVDENLQIIPQTQAYKILNVFKYIFITLIVIGIGIGAYFLTLKNIEKIKKWLEPEY